MSGVPLRNAIIGKRRGEYVKITTWVTKDELDGQLGEYIVFSDDDSSEISAHTPARIREPIKPPSAPQKPARK